MIAANLAHALDPVRFMRDAGFRPDPWQEGVLRSTACRSLLLCSRQVGKSTVTAAIASHTALFQPGSLILLIAPSQSQSRELYRKVAGFLREASDADPEAESAMRLELSNGSRIISLSGNPTTARGFSGPRLVVLDEAAWVSDELFHSITPMLAAGGRLIALSTPFGRRGWLYEAWANNDPLWERTRITADQSPRITEEFLSAERAAKPDWRIRQEYFCEFVDNDETLFGSEMVARALTPAVSPLFSQPFQW